MVDVYHTPDGDKPDLSVSLLKEGNEYPLFDTFKFVAPKQLTDVRKASLLKDVYSILARNRKDMTDEAHKFLEELWFRTT